MHEKAMDKINYPTLAEPAQAISNLRLLSNLPIRSYELYLDIQRRIDVTLERTVDTKTGGIRWAIRHRGHCLNKSAQWEREGFGSNLNEEFYRETRWDSPEEAYRFWVENDCENRFRGD